MTQISSKHDNKHTKYVNKISSKKKKKKVNKIHVHRQSSHDGRR